MRVRNALVQSMITLFDLRLHPILMSCDIPQDDTVLLNGEVSVVGRCVRTADERVALASELDGQFKGVA